MKIFISVMLVGILVGITGCVASVSENALIRPTPGEKLANGPSPDGFWSVRTIDMPRKGGANLYAAQFSRPDSKALVLYFGGNSFTISRFYQSVLDIYAPHPVDVLIADHRGYGGSTGAATLDALMEDAVETYDFVRALPQYQGPPIIVHGQSLGSFMAGEVAKRRSLDALVLESSATTAEDWVQGFVDNSMLIRRGEVQGSLKGKGNLAVMRTLDEPVLIVVGQEDKTTRSEMSAQLYSAAIVDETRKELLVVSGAGHNNASKSLEYRASFARLLARIKR